VDIVVTAKLGVKLVGEMDIIMFQLTKVAREIKYVTLAKAANSSKKNVKSVMDKEK
jgi:hypothetical protein